MAVHGRRRCCAAKGSAVGASGSPASCGRKACTRGVHGRASHARPTASTQPVAPNLLARHFTADAPNRKWVAAITGIATRTGWLYLAGILDVYSRRAIGYAMDCSRDERLVEDALHMALTSRRPRAGSGLLHHSDRGSQYTAGAYRDLLDAYGITMSMSEKGEPYDNALMESFFATLKVECVQRHDFQTPEQARACIFEYLEVFYNRQRLHSSLGYSSPMAFEHLPVDT